MKHIIYTPNPTNKYKVAILIKSSSFQKDSIKRYYVDPLINLGLKEEDILAMDLEYDGSKKVKAKYAKEYISTLTKALESLDVTHLLIADSDYFRYFCKLTKVSGQIGVVHSLESHFKACMTYSFDALFHQPTLQTKIDLSLTTLVNSLNGLDFGIGHNVLHSAHYPKGKIEIANWLDKLQDYPMLAIDIETTGLAYNSEILSIGFAWDENNGIAFSINDKALDALHYFFSTYTGSLFGHNLTFDFKLLIHNIWMEDSLDNKGLIVGLEILTSNFHDSKTIAYLATNTTSGNNLGLKELAHEHLGNYAVDVTDASSVPIAELLEYNLMDCLGSFYVFNKYYPIMVKDNQLGIYNNIMLPSLKTIIHMELTGLALDIEQVHKTNDELKVIRDTSLNDLLYTNTVKQFEVQLRKEEMIKKNLLLKVKVRPLTDFDSLTYMPSSNQQTSKLLFEFMGLPVLDTTDGGSPAVGAKTIKKLLNHTTDKEYLIILQALINLSECTIILNTFVSAFIAKSIRKNDGVYYLHGNFNSAKVKSMRLSSSKVNLQNLPSTGSTYSKHIKKCFVAPPNWIMVGSDYDGLESVTQALITKDPEMLKVFTDGFDAHSLRAANFFPEDLPDDIDKNDPKSINSIKKNYPDVRQAAKSPYFLLQYQGTYMGLIEQFGFSKEKSIAIEESYHDLYKVSDDWVKAHIDKASSTGYVPLAFGGRLRTPILSQTLLHKKSTPYAASAEARTAGNALTQSYGLLNSRSTNEFMDRVYKSKYRNVIKPMAMIHDSSYYLIEDSIGCLKWVNDNLIDCMKWSGLPELQHPTVGMSGELSVFYPSWKDEISLKNNISMQEILDICNK